MALSAEFLALLPLFFSLVVSVVAEGEFSILDLIMMSVGLLFYSELDAIR